MTKRRDPTPDTLVPAAGTLPRLSARERDLLAFALGAFGEQLTRFLLAGLGTKISAPGWRFAITSADEADGGYERLIEVIAPEPRRGSSLLPRSRDPLVLLALLRLLPLTADGGFAARLSYDCGDVLKLLGWDDDGEARREIDEAVGRYSSLTYFSEARGIEAEGRNKGFYKIRERPISSFSTVDEGGEGGALKRISNRVTFSEFFVDGLARRSLLGIEWANVRSIKLVPGRVRRDSGRSI